MLAMCEKAAPVVVSICDCTSHMVDGGKKEAEFIMEYFSKKVVEFDSTGLFTDCFFFDGVTNIQQAGIILCAKYPRAMSFHGGEYVLSLFFSDLAKIHPIQVCEKFIEHFFMNI